VFAAEFKNVEKRYHHNKVLKEFDLSIEESEFTVIFGEPGCGKSVILRLLTAIEKPDGGAIFIRGQNITGLSSADLNIGYIPQSFALYPHYSVFDNIAYPLTLIKHPKNEIKKAVNDAAEMLRIHNLLGKRPDQLSGGEKQRVALARGIVKKTNLFVFDDPLAGLDFKLREQLIDDLKEMQKIMGATFIYATSDPLEALMLAHYISILHDGRIIENGPLINVYENPKHVKTIELLDYPRANIFKGKLAKLNKQLVCKTIFFDFPVRVEKEDKIMDGKKVYVGIRAGDILPGAKDKKDCASFNGNIILKEDLGSELLVHINYENLKLISVVRHEDEVLISKDNEYFRVPYDSIAIYDEIDGVRIGRGGYIDYA